MRFDHRYLIAVIIVVAIAVFAITWVGIRESRSDSFKLMVLQGTSFTEALAQASENAIAAEGYYERILQRRYRDLVATLLEIDPRRLTSAGLVAFAQSHELDAIYIYAADSNIIISGTFQGDRLALPEFVDSEVKKLIANPVSRSLLLTDPDNTDRSYYVEVTNQLDRAVVFEDDVRTYHDALNQTGIGYLAQKMAREEGVEYIIYQSTKGIVFASREPGDLLAIESDPFLRQALDGDTIISRVHRFQGQEVLEMVRPFATRRYPLGVFRVGLSLSGYNAVSRGFDQQMILLSAVLFVLITVVILYVNSRRRRQEISQEFSTMKSVTDRIFDQMRVGVTVIDESGSVRMANAAFAKTLGVRVAPGQAWPQVPSLRALGLDQFLEEPAESDELEVSVGTADEEKTLLVARSKLKLRETGRAEVVMVVYDVTRLRKYEQEGSRRERLSELGNLAAGVAHEIRNPLNTIAIATQRLAAEFSPVENREEYVAFTEKIRSEIARLNEIITRFLTLARDDSKRATRIWLGRELEELQALIRPEAERLEITLRMSAAEGLYIEGNPDGWRQVMLNLYNNAKEALAGGTGSITIEAARSGSHVVVSVSDSGPGIPDELHERVFTPYFTTKNAGTGLGLAAVHRIIMEMGGQISVRRSAELGGAEFVIRLPSV